MAIVGRPAGLPKATERSDSGNGVHVDGRSNTVCGVSMYVEKIATRISECRRQSALAGLFLTRPVHCEVILPTSTKGVRQSTGNEAEKFSGPYAVQ